MDSVGAALTALQVSGPVYSEFQLNIPFDFEKESRAWGYADLTENRVDIEAPPMTLENATGVSPSTMMWLPHRVCRPNYYNSLSLLISMGRVRSKATT